MKNYTPYEASKLTQHDKILAIMESDPGKIWWNPVDILNHPLHRTLFVGYKASARMSELPQMYPDRVESKRDGKYRYIKLITGKLEL